MNKRTTRRLLEGSFLALTILGLIAVGGREVLGQTATIRTLDPWKYGAGNIITPRVSSSSVQVPSLANCDTIDTNASGTFACGTDGGGGGGGTVGPSTSTYVSVFDSSSTITGYSNFTFNSATGLFTAPTSSFSYLGIGTLAPSSTLHVVASGNGTAIQASVNSSADSSAGLLLTNLSGSTGIGGLSLYPTQADSGGYLTFGGTPTAANGFPTQMTSIAVDRFPGTFGYFATTANNTSRFYFRTAPVGTTQTLTEVMSILNNGNVGIGTTQPSSTLHVVGGISVTPSSSASKANVGGTIFDNVATVGNGAATETSLASSTVSTSTLINNGDAIKYSAAGTFANTASTDKRIKLVISNLGGATTTVYDSGNLAIITAQSWTLDGYCVRTGANAQKCRTNVQISGFGALMADAEYATATVTSTQAISFGLLGGGTNANDTVKELWRGEYSPTP